MANGGRMNGWTKVLVGLAASLLTLAVAWGAVQQQQKQNCEDLRKLDAEKLSKEVFQQHCDSQRISDERIEKRLAEIRAEQQAGFERLERKLDGQ